TAAFAGVEQDCSQTADDALAIKACSALIQHDPENTDALSQRGNALLRSGDRDRAIADFTEVIRILPDNPYGYNDRGRAPSSKGSYDRAIADHTEALKLEQQAEFLLERGRAYRLKGAYDLAIADHTEAIRLEPANDSLYAERGQDHLAKKDYASAVAD